MGYITRLFEAEIHAYVLMPNHYHLLIHTPAPAGNLSRCIRHLNGVYTQRFNVNHKIDGSLFRGRFKSILIEQESYLLELVRYIHKNPQKAGLKAFVKKEIPKDLLKRLESINWPTILGGKEFKEKIKKKYLGEEIDVKEKPAYRRDIIRSEQTKEDINRLVSDNRDILERKRIRKYTERRRALIYLLRRYYALNLTEISEIVGRSNVFSGVKAIQASGKGCEKRGRLL